MKRFLVLVFFLSCALSALGQPKSTNPAVAQSDIPVRKHIICDDLERQAKEIPFAAVRVFARYKLASWLWKDGKDDTSRAEQMAVAAIDDLYENRAEVPQFYFNQLSTGLLALLDRNAKNAADKFREKHKIAPENDSSLFGPSLDQPGGDKIAVDRAIRSLVNQSETNTSLVLLMGELQRRQSRELFRLLNAVIQAEETGQTRFATVMLNFMSGYFVGNDVPNELQKRFLKLAVNRSRIAAQMPGGDIDGYFQLLSGLMPVITTKFPKLLPEAGAVQNILKTQASIGSREAQERKERIANSPDKLSAIVTEAERTDNKGTKYELYVWAAQLASDQKKFIYSIDLIEKTAEIDLASNAISEAFRKRWRDEVFGEVVEKALKSNDPDSANYAAKKIVSSTEKAESLGKIAAYYIERDDPVFARSALEEAVKFAGKTETDARSISCLIRLLPTAQKIDPNYVFTLNGLTAKSINAIPTLDIEDKPQTENYKNYVTSIMSINWNLLPALTKLIKVNKNGATDLANRINRKEIKIIADYILLTDSLNQSTEQKKTKDEVKKPAQTNKLF